MKNIKGFVVGLVLGLGLTLSAVGFAQDTRQTEQNQKTESCCAMTTCCCKGESCSMKDHATKEHAKNHSHKDGCCCCSGDSCNINMKVKQDKQKQG